ncbi:MAG: nicotinate-nucleotide adenylyltransferase [Candidatus Omnitrophota bacterium]
MARQENKKNNMAKSIGILGGTFNPPHIGHLVIAQDILEALELDRVFFIPTNISPHKETGNAGAAQRLEMTRLTIAENENFKVLDLEIKRGGTSYTVDTVRKLKDNYPNDELYLIVGSDLANTFSSWKDIQELKKLAKIVAAQRKNYPLKEKDSFLIVNIRQVDISSSRIRDLVKKGKSIRGFVKQGVVEYINQHRLYV